MEKWWEKSVTTLKGIGPSKTVALAKLNIFTIGQLLEHYPRTYEDRSNPKFISEFVSGQFQVFNATVIQVIEKRFGRKSLLTLVVKDESGTANLKWFNQSYKKKCYHIGEKVKVYGKSEYKYGEWEMIQPDITTNLDLEDEPIVPIYPSTESVSQGFLRSITRKALKNFGSTITENIPYHILSTYGLISKKEALQSIHFPSTMETVERAHYRLVFEELYLLQYGLLYIKYKNQHNLPGISFSKESKLVKEVEKRLPFCLTHDQEIVLSEVKADMEKPIPMQRLIQGDVGSGKTVIAAFAMTKAVENGYQATLMAPTEILAEQHYHTIARLLSFVGVKTALLTGKLTRRTKEEILSRLASGTIDILIGTHALLQENVVFHKLGIVVTDEQHRFGVKQRAILEDKGHSAPDVLVMTATPIPRTMALTVYGDLDISQIRQLPPGRKEIKTVALSFSLRYQVYERLINQLKEGRQAYIVCPLIDESEDIEAASVKEVYEELSLKFFKEFQCGLLHGKLTPHEKEAVIHSFYQGETNVLFATTVVEVGVNVPNATVMVIEQAERFGLAQLHQLRGRVGRGEHQSFCILFYKGERNHIPERLQIMMETNDGFTLAEKDLEVRGPGQFFGTRQHGMPDLKIANILKDTKILIKARQAALLCIKDHKNESTILQAVVDKFDNNFKGILLS